MEESALGGGGQPGVQSQQGGIQVAGEPEVASIVSRKPVADG